MKYNIYARQILFEKIYNYDPKIDCLSLKLYIRASKFGDQRGWTYGSAVVCPG